MSPPLFKVPGWPVSTELASSSSSKKSKKRKRAHDPNVSSGKLESAQVNLEKLMGTLDPADSVRRPPKKKHKGKQPTDSSERVANKKPVATTKPKDSVEKAATKDVKEPSKKPTETQLASKEKGKSKSQRPTKVDGSTNSNLTTLQNRMKNKLDGARFR